MDEQTYKRLKVWIFENHEHHADADGVSFNIDENEWTDEGGTSDCFDGDYPYVNSLSLEGFIDSLVDPTWAASYQYGGK